MNDQMEKLHRWDNKMPLMVEEREASVEVYTAGSPEEKRVEVDVEEEEESIETSEESSEEESSDSEDIKRLKERILAQPIIDEEDTYHPRGKPVLHQNPEPPPIPAHKVPILDISPPVPSRPLSLPSSPTNVMPKSILKKRTETEVIPLNQFGRPIPPEKPIRKTLPQEEQRPQQQDIVTLRKKSLTNTPDAMRGAAISESDIDNSNVLSAAEVARNRRRQIRQTSLEEEAEANMAVINHYTEIVKEHSVAHSVHPVYLKREDLKRAISSDDEKPPPGEYGPKRESTDGIGSREKNDEGLIMANDVKEKKRKTSVSNDKKMLEKALSPERKRETAERIKAPTPKRDAHENELSLQNRRPNTTESKKSVENQVAKTSSNPEDQQPKSRRNSVSSRGTTPAREGREHRQSRPPSRNESPAPRSRNVSGERASSRPPSRTENRGLSQERSLPRRSRPPSRNASEEMRSTRDKSLDKRKSSRPSSRSNSRDRFRPETPSEVRMERLHQVLDGKRYRTRKSIVDREYSDNVEDLTAKAEKKVRSTLSYVTDLTLLTAAVYVYFLKSEVLAIPFIGLLLYRQIQEEIHRRLPKWWKEKK